MRRTIRVKSSDAYIKGVLLQLNSLNRSQVYGQAEVSAAALSATLLICNMALDHTIASPDLLPFLADVRDDVAAHMIEDAARNGIDIERL